MFPFPDVILPVSFWLYSAKDYTWGMAVGTLINSCFQVTATHSLYQLPRVLLSMCRKLRAGENSINFIIVGEKILQVEQTGSHWEMMGLKGRNEICEHSSKYTDISILVVLCKKQNLEQFCFLLWL